MTQQTQQEEKIIDIRKLLKNIVAYNSSDLHLVVGSEPQIRIDGKLIPLNLPILDGPTIEKMCYTLLTDKQKKLLEENKEIDFALAIPNVGRFRGNYNYTFGGDLAAAFRIIPTEIPSLDELNAPAIFKEVIKREKGLILVTGPTGSGKSTTLASIINHINKHQRKHIITIEDPVEFVHKDQNCMINQRSLGQDTISFSRALRAALREDPDIILVGEMRDLETIEMALHAAETGHLVFSTLHTLDVKETINRIISMFPSEEQNRIRVVLASVLESVISQRLVKRKDGGRIAAVEVMFRTKRIETLIEEGREMELTDAIEDGTVYGMQTFDQALLDLYKKGLINEEEALNNATSRADMKLKLEGIVDKTSQIDSSMVGEDKDEDVIDLKI